ncbi:MAG: hypothetical protein QJR03_06005 [Sphaerobacter sp.]|nr:hypothetical protein [Sphaerobacter sp.]
MTPGDGARVLVADPAWGRLSRRAFLRRTAALGVAGVGLPALLAACGGGGGGNTPQPGSSGSPASGSGGASGGTGATRPLTPTFYQWIMNLHPAIDKAVNAEFSKSHKLDAQIAPVQGFGIDRFVAEARDKNST